MTMASILPPMISRARTPATSSRRSRPWRLSQTVVPATPRMPKRTQLTRPPVDDWSNPPAQVRGGAAGIDCTATVDRRAGQLGVGQASWPAASSASSTGPPVSTATCSAAVSG